MEPQPSCPQTLRPHCLNVWVTPSGWSGKDWLQEEMQTPPQVGPGCGTLSCARKWGGASRSLWTGTGTMQETGSAKSREEGAWRLRP